MSHPAKLQVRFVNEKAIYHALRESVFHALESAEKDILGSRKCDRDVKGLVKNKEGQGIHVSVDAEKVLDLSSPMKSFLCHDDAPEVEDSIRKIKKKPGPEIPHASLFQWGSIGKEIQSDDLKIQKNPSRPDLSFQEVVEGDRNKEVTLTGEGDESIAKNRVSDGVVENYDFDKDSHELLNSSHKFDAFHGDCRIVGQVLGTYIIVEDSDGVELIDQHAAHERIMYEQLKKRSDTFKPPSQQVLVPPVLDFNFSQSAVFQRMIPGLSELGFEIEPFGEKTFAVKSVPAIIDSSDVGVLLHDMVDNVMESGLGCDGGGIEKRAWLDGCLILIACHHSVRANQSLTGKEMGQLVRDLDRCENAFYCPHGRPIRISWSPKDLQHMFKRIV